MLENIKPWERKAAMLFLRERIGQTLQWRRPHFFATNYELCGGNQLLATLHRPGMMKQSAFGEAEGQQWAFQREGLLGRKCVIYAVHHANEPMQELAMIQP